MKEILSKYRQYVVVNKSGTVIDVSESFCYLTEYSREELIGLTAKDLFHNMLRLRMPYPFQDSKADTYLFTKSLQARRIHIDTARSGSFGHLEYRFYEIPGSRFEDNNRFVEQLIYENRVGVGVYSPDLILLRANQAYLDYLPEPYRTNELAIGRHIGELNAGFDGSDEEKHWKQIKASQRSVYFKEKVRISGNVSRYWEKSITPIFEDGRVAFYVSVLRDVTENVCVREAMREKQIETEYKIKQQKEELDVLLDNMPDGLILLDSDGVIRKVNPAAQKILGQESFEPMFYWNCTPPYRLTDLNGYALPREEWPIARVLAKKRFSGLEFWLHYLDSDKPPRLCSFSGTPVYGENGEMIFGFITFIDITKQRMLQEQLINAIKEKNEVLSEAIAFKDEFLYLITHEMKTPLAVISSALQTMNMVCDDMPFKAVKYLKTIRQNTNRQLRLVNNLLDIVRINTGAIKLNNRLFDIVYLTDMIVKSVQPIAIQRGIQINFISDIKKKVISIDEEKVERILLNLLSNALKFTPRNKQIHVRISAKRVRSNNMICISIRDEGIGIPKEKQTCIFERFGQAGSTRSKPHEGTGIGLYLVKLLVTAMDGFITLESEEEAGSNFTVMLPAKKTSDESPLPDNDTVSECDSRLIHELEIQFSDIYF